MVWYSEELIMLWITPKGSHWNLYVNLSERCKVSQLYTPGILISKLSGYKTHFYPSKHKWRPKTRQQLKRTKAEIFHPASILYPLHLDLGLWQPGTSLQFTHCYFRVSWQINPNCLPSSVLFFLYFPQIQYIQKKSVEVLLEMRSYSMQRALELVVKFCSSTFGEFL